MSSRYIAQQPLSHLSMAQVMVYEKTWSQIWTDEQGTSWQLVELEASNGEVYEKWEVIPQFAGPLPEKRKREPTDHDKDEPTGHDNNEVLERKMPRLRTVSVYARAV